METKKNFYVNLYILIPLIFAGITILGVFAAYQLAASPEKTHHSLIFNIYTLAFVIGCISFFAGFFILRLLLKPLDDFAEKTKKMPVFSDDQPGEAVNITDDLSRINQMFDSVVNILSHVEARELFPRIVGPGAAMRHIFTQIIKVAPTDSTVLITGESGTGKELIAAGIYEHSRRQGKPFVAINCVAIPEGLLESELFGHEKGAFTGATAQKKGKFELADGGTVFLDEIGDMPPATQAKLLRVLQEKKFERVGGGQTIHVDVRFIAATNKNLPEMIKTGAFREDLFYRLNVLSIHLPPLRERMEDIPFLVEHFLGQSGKELKISPRAMQVMIGYDWPGNVRELQNV
ncbi:MAG: sigma 54-interacting transcriptional regulator, partial [Smithellaceae bacterium]